ncbi:carbamoyl phosphate synthase small subunit [Mesobacillus harenae]|uniref:carbamoyl phosphate synthase small subunit n=1 Tax=Mesobacillus harenae TaxID=2213203 RepID=UPI0015807460|nr:carbamoyl phosphate synthase small subunit [Mesobacillus harenae]
MSGYLHLENGKSFEGTWLNKPIEKEVTGEIVFFTGMTGYQEVLTDPSYKDQIVVFTYPLIGNYGINKEDFESKRPYVAGVIVYELSPVPSHYQSAWSLQEYLEKWDIPLLGAVDTRALVKGIREHGSMPAVLASTEEVDSTFVLPRGLKVADVSVSKPVTYGNGDFRVVVMDYGCKQSIIDSLVEQDCQVILVPYHFSFQQISALQPDGIVLSNGPGDPKDLTDYLKTVKQVIQSYPVLGICLGHQLAALALGGNTKRMLFGHRGANQPIHDLKGNKVFMSSQNHSYVVDETSLQGTGLEVRYFNCNDQTVEGLSHVSLPLQTVQFHPEAHPGPEESGVIFTEFIDTIKINSGSSVSYA